MQDSEVLERNSLGNDNSGEACLSRPLRGSNKKSVALQDSVCYIILRSALKAISKNKHKILYSHFF